MIPRLAIEHLGEWKSNPNRKPLIISGARQVGKTTLINEFASQFENYLSFNLEISADLSLFDRFSDTNKLVQALFLERGLLFDAHNTLIFIDEIQESANAIVQLHYISEKYPSLPVICSSSLPENVLNRVTSFPVGAVDSFVLHPISFHEYLLGQGKMGVLAAFLETPVPDYAHDRLMNVFNEYAIIGGMPEIVQAFHEESDYTRLAGIYDGLLASYRNDILKYARNPTSLSVLRHVLQTSSNVADRRIKFERFGNSNYKSREVGEAMRTLELARILRLVYPITTTVIPWGSNRKKSPRLQFLDTGLVNYSNGIQHSLLGLQDLSLEYRGHVTRHLTTQEITSRHSSSTYEPIFWIRPEPGSQAEVDFVYPFENLLIPIEVKSGKQGRLRSLHQFIDKCPHTFAIRLYGGALMLEPAKTIKGKSFRLLNLPYYLAGRIPEYTAWLINSSQ